ncbi:MAG: glycosyltransferase [Alphaproteobacteria bacterium]
MIDISNGSQTPNLAACVQQNVCVVCASNDEAVLKRDLLSSPLISKSDVPIYIYRDSRCISEAYNKGINDCDREIIVFAHQDVYLPEGWEQNLARAIEWLEEKSAKWAVLGIVGVTYENQIVGTIWSSGASREYSTQMEYPLLTTSIDEVVIVLNKSSGIRFDGSLPNFHLYGTDIVRIAQKAGYDSFVIYAPVIHNSNQLRGLDAGYRLAYRFMKKKWRDHLPIKTSVCTISKYNFSLFINHIRIMRNYLKARILNRVNGPVEDPKLLSTKLNYDKPNPSNLNLN